jgi:hypothetical protein
MFAMSILVIVLDEDTLFASGVKPPAKARLAVALAVSVGVVLVSVLMPSGLLRS